MELFYNKWELISEAFLAFMPINPLTFHIFVFVHCHSTCCRKQKSTGGSIIKYSSLEAQIDKNKRMENILKTEEKYFELVKDKTEN